MMFLETLGLDSQLIFKTKRVSSLGCIPGVTEARVVSREESTALVPMAFREEDLIELEPDDVEEDIPIVSAAGPVEKTESLQGVQGAIDVRPLKS